MLSFIATLVPAVFCCVDCYVSALCPVLHLIVTLVRFVVVVFDCDVSARCARYLR